MRFLRLPAMLLASLTLCAQAPAPNAGAPPDASFLSNPKFVEMLKEAKLYQRQKRMPFAYDDYKKANKIAEGKCLDCLRGMNQTAMAMGEFKDAVNAAAHWEALEDTPAGKSLAQTMRAQAMDAAAGQKPKPAQLEAVHAVYQQAIASYPKNATAHFSDGRVLARLGRMEDAKAQFTECLSCVRAADPARLRAEHFAQDPELSLHKMAPAFEVTALDGTRFNLDAMGGRVVLIDFWATWCPSCVEEIPHVRKIAQEFANQPLMIISVSWDSDDAKWKQYIQKNEMTWMQYRDADHKLGNLFGINEIPHYFTIDSDGVLTAEIIGGGSDVEGRLKKMLAKAHEAQQHASAQPQAGN